MIYNREIKALVLATSVQHLITHADKCGWHIQNITYSCSIFLHWENRQVHKYFTKSEPANVSSHPLLNSQHNTCVVLCGFNICHREPVPMDLKLYNFTIFRHAGEIRLIPCAPNTKHWSTNVHCAVKSTCISMPFVYRSIPIGAQGTQSNPFCGSGI